MRPFLLVEHTQHWRTMTGNKESANVRVRRALEGVHATITREDKGGIDFELDGIDGFAREHRGRLRVSYFIAIDPDPEEAAEFIAAHADTTHGTVESIAAQHGTALRLLVELPFDRDQEIWTTANTARALHTGWVNRHAGIADLLATLSAAGIAVPPRQPRPVVHTYGAWSWGNRYLPPFQMYMFDVGLVARQLTAHGGFFALSHAGHGINSYGLNLVTAKGHIAAFVQHGYGGAYSNPVHDLIDINATYSRLHLLLRAFKADRPDMPRLLVTYSSFRGGAELIDLEHLRCGANLEDATEPFDGESELFEAVVGRLALRNLDFGTAGNVSW